MSSTSQEQQFIKAINVFQPAHQNIDAQINVLQQWLTQTTKALKAASICQPDLQQHSALNQQIETIQSTLVHTIQNWDEQWLALAPVKSLADTFDNKIILLVFGKFNAGKSSFCNLLAQRFAAQGQSVQYFCLTEEHISPMEHSFKEGSTETTAQIQGVILGDKFVLLDTPGLHSITTENALLTKRFTDSADGMLWLTSSSSPGQVQELEEVSRELHRQKSLLPIITRSDFIEEDELNGEIIKCLRNKSADNRALQESDIKERTYEKLEQMAVSPHLLKEPVSISVYAAKEQGLNAIALNEAGFERLYAALQALIEPALAYKAHKPAYMLLHHLEENVLGSLHTVLLPLLNQLEQHLGTEQQQLQKNQLNTVTTTWRAVISTLADLLEQHEGQNQLPTLIEAVSAQLQPILSEQIQLHFANYTFSLTDYIRPLELPDENLAADDYEALYGLLENGIHQHLETICAELLERCSSPLKDLQTQIHAQKNVLTAQTAALNKLKTQLSPASLS